MSLANAELSAAKRDQLNQPVALYRNPPATGTSKAIPEGLRNAATGGAAASTILATVLEPGGWRAAWHQAEREQHPEIELEVAYL
jgi:hypothetical protein